MRRFFVDTFYVIALSNRRDQWHRRVVTFSRALRDVRLYTVDDVRAEFLTFSSTLGAHTFSDPCCGYTAQRSPRSAEGSRLYS
jgi:hypothetical protein